MRLGALAGAGRSQDGAQNAQQRRPASAGPARALFRNTVDGAALLEGLEAGPTLRVLTTGLGDQMASGRRMVPVGRLGHETFWRPLGALGVDFLLRHHARVVSAGGFPARH